MRAIPRSPHLLAGFAFTFATALLVASISGFLIQYIAANLNGMLAFGVIGFVAMVVCLLSQASQQQSESTKEARRRGLPPSREKATL